MGLRVLYLCNAAPIGGGNRSLLTLWAGLQRGEVEPLAVSPEPGAMVDVTASAGIDCRIMPYHQPARSTPARNWRYRRRWRALLKTLQPQLVHANGLAAARSVARAADDLSIPMLCHIRSSPDRAWIAWAFRRLPPPRVFIFNSAALRAQISHDLKQACPASQQVVIHNAIDTDTFTPRPPHRGHGRRIGMIANLAPVKGHDDLLHAVRILAARGLDIECILMGEDIHQTGYRDTLVATADSLGIAHTLRFMGHITDPAPLIRELDVVVCASHSEAFGRCTAEAMACAVPVVATRVGGIPEVIADGQTGMLVPPHSPQEIADAVHELLTDPALRQRMGDAGRHRAVSHFGMAMHAERTLSLYRGVRAGSIAPTVSIPASGAA